jgi:hypothetical protein
MLAVLVAGTLAARIVVYLLGADYCGSCRNMAPFRALAEELGQAGFTGAGTILVDGFHVGGNARVEFPGARIIDAAYPPSVWPAPQGDGQCLLLWQDRGDPGYNDAARRYLESYLTEELNGDATAPHDEGVVSALMFGSDTREYRLGYRLYAGSVGDCR